MATVKIHCTWYVQCFDAWNCKEIKDHCNKFGRQSQFFRRIIPWHSFSMGTMIHSFSFIAYFTYTWTMQNEQIILRIYALNTLCATCHWLSSFASLTKFSYFHCETTSNQVTLTEENKKKSENNHASKPACTYVHRPNSQIELANLIFDAKRGNELK